MSILLVKSFVEDLFLHIEYYKVIFVNILVCIQIRSSISWIVMHVLGAGSPSL